MRAKLFDFDSVDVDDLRTHKPRGDDWVVPITLHIGIEGEPGMDLFSFEVCSPAWLPKQVANGTVVSGRHRLIMHVYRFERLMGEVERRIHISEGSNWDEIAAKLSRWFHWEFEDMDKGRFAEELN